MTRRHIRGCKDRYKQLLSHFVRPSFLMLKAMLLVSVIQGKAWVWESFWRPSFQMGQVWRTGFQSFCILVGITANGLARTSLSGGLPQFLFEASWPSNVPAMAAMATFEARILASWARQLSCVCSCVYIVQNQHETCKSNCLFKVIPFWKSSCSVCTLNFRDIGPSFLTCFSWTNLRLRSKYQIQRTRSQNDFMHHKCLRQGIFMKTSRRHLWPDSLIHLTWRLTRHRTHHQPQLRRQIQHLGCFRLTHCHVKHCRRAHQCIFKECMESLKSTAIQYPKTRSALWKRFRLRFLPQLTEESVL